MSLDRGKDRLDRGVTLKPDRWHRQKIERVSMSARHGATTARDYAGRGAKKGGVVLVKTVTVVKRSTVTVANDFRKFLLQDIVINMTIGVIIGHGFVAVVRSLVSDILSPPLALLVDGGVIGEQFIILRRGSNESNFTSYDTIQSAKDSGAITLNIGNFLVALFNFLILSICIYLVVKFVVWVKKRDAVKEEEKVECPRCCEMVIIRATRCSHCGHEPLNLQKVQTITGEEIVVVPASDDESEDRKKDRDHDRDNEREREHESRHHHHHQSERDLDSVRDDLSDFGDDRDDDRRAKEHRHRLREDEDPRAVNVPVPRLY